MFVFLSWKSSASKPDQVFTTLLRTGVCCKTWTKVKYVEVLRKERFWLAGLSQPLLDPHSSVSSSATSSPPSSEPSMASPPSQVLLRFSKNQLEISRGTHTAQWENITLENRWRHEFLILKLSPWVLTLNCLNCFFLSNSLTLLPINWVFTLSVTFFLKKNLC